MGRRTRLFPASTRVCDSAGGRQRAAHDRTRRRLGLGRTIERMFLAGVPVRDELVLELARMVDDEALAEKLEDAYRREVKVMALDVPERETILRALEDPPAGLEDLRAVPLHLPSTTAPTQPSPSPSRGSRDARSPSSTRAGHRRLRVSTRSAASASHGRGKSGHGRRQAAGRSSFRAARRGR